MTTYQSASAFRNQLDYSTTSEETAHMNNYLATLLMPGKYTGELAMIPDEDMTQSLSKQINMSQNIKLHGDGFILYRPCARSRQVTLWGFSPATQRFNVCKDLTYDQDISTDFDRFRSVSGYLGMVSSTVSGSTFDVAGMMNAVSVNILPELRTLNFSTLTSFGMDDSAHFSSQQISRGLLALMAPTGTHHYRMTETNATYMEGEEIRVDKQYNGAGSGWSVLGLGVGGVLYDSDLDTRPFPVNLWGKMDLQGQFVTNQTVFADSARWQVEITSVKCADTTDYNEVPVVNTYYFYGGYSAIGGTVTNAFSLPSIDTFGILTRIRILNAAGGASVSTLITSGTTNVLQLRCYSLMEEGFNGPASIIAWSGVTEGQMMAVDSTYNLEVVPDSNLSKNVKTQFSKFSRPEDIFTAEYVLANRARLGLRHIYDLTEYHSLISSGSFEKISDRSQATYQTASLRENFRKGLGFIRKNSPGLIRSGGRLAQFVGNAYGNSGLAEIGNSMAEYQTASPGTPKTNDNNKKPVYYCASSDSDSTDADDAATDDAPEDTDCPILTYQEWKMLDNPPRQFVRLPESEAPGKSSIAKRWQNASKGNIGGKFWCGGYKHLGTSAQFRYLANDLTLPPHRQCCIFVNAAYTRISSQYGFFEEKLLRIVANLKSKGVITQYETKEPYKPKARITKNPNGALGVTNNSFNDPIPVVGNLEVSHSKIQVTVPGEFVKPYVLELRQLGHKFVPPRKGNVYNDNEVVIVQGPFRKPDDPKPSNVYYNVLVKRDQKDKFMIASGVAAEKCKLKTHSEFTQKTMDMLKQLREKQLSQMRLKDLANQASVALPMRPSPMEFDTTSITPRVGRFSGKYLKIRLAPEPVEDLVDIKIDDREVTFVRVNGDIYSCLLGPVDLPGELNVQIGSATFILTPLIYVPDGNASTHTCTSYSGIDVDSIMDRALHEEGYGEEGFTEIQGPSDSDVTGTEADNEEPQGSQLPDWAGRLTDPFSGTKLDHYNSGKRLLSVDTNIETGNSTKHSVSFWWNKAYFPAISKDPNFNNMICSVFVATQMPKYSTYCKIKQWAAVTGLSGEQYFVPKYIGIAGGVHMVNIMDGCNLLWRSPENYWRYLWYSWDQYDPELHNERENSNEQHDVTFRGSSSGLAIFCACALLPYGPILSGSCTFGGGSLTDRFPKMGPIGSAPQKVALACVARSAGTSSTAMWPIIIYPDPNDLAVVAKAAVKYGRKLVSAEKLVFSKYDGVIDIFICSHFIEFFVGFNALMRKSGAIQKTSGTDHLKPSTHKPAISTIEELRKNTQKSIDQNVQTRMASPHANVKGKGSEVNIDLDATMKLVELIDQNWSETLNGISSVQSAEEWEVVKELFELSADEDVARGLKHLSDEKLRAMARNRLQFKNNKNMLPQQRVNTQTKYWNQARELALLSLKMKRALVPKVVQNMKSPYASVADKRRAAKARQGSAVHTGIKQEKLNRLLSLLDTE